MSDDRAEIKSDPATAPLSGMYRIQFTKPGGRITLESQMRLFDRSTDPIRGLTLWFSARPRFGTTTFAAREIASMYRVPDDAEVYVNWDPRKQGKPQSWKYER
jgi:hypothetical protein